MDLLEKRIRSRFSHRRLLLGEPCIGHVPAGAAGQRLLPSQHVSKPLCIVQSDDWQPCRSQGHGNSCRPMLHVYCHPTAQQRGSIKSID
jgi:hypothetical protein